MLPGPFCPLQCHCVAGALASPPGSGGPRKVSEHSRGQLPARARLWENGFLLVSVRKLSLARQHEDSTRRGSLPVFVAQLLGLEGLCAVSPDFCHSETSSGAEPEPQ